MKLSEAFTNETNTRRVFSWLTRIGAGPRFGSRPIAWYQMHQCCAIDILKELGADEVRYARGYIETKCGGWRSVITPKALFDKADELTRKG